MGSSVRGPVASRRGVVGEMCPLCQKEKHPRRGFAALLDLRVLWPWLSPASRKLRRVSNQVAWKRFRNQGV